MLDATRNRAAYIMDASAIMQNDADPENVRAMTDFTREHGVFSRSASMPDATAPALAHDLPPDSSRHLAHRSRTAPGACEPYTSYRSRLGQINGDEQLIRQAWEQTDGLANAYIWQVLLSF